MPYYHHQRRHLAAHAEREVALVERGQRRADRDARRAAGRVHRRALHDGEEVVAARVRDVQHAARREHLLEERAVHRRAERIGRERATERLPVALQQDRRPVRRARVRDQVGVRGGEVPEQPEAVAVGRGGGGARHRGERAGRGRIVIRELHGEQARGDPGRAADALALRVRGATEAGRRDVAPHALERQSRLELQLADALLRLERARRGAAQRVHRRHDERADREGDHELEQREASPLAGARRAPRLACAPAHGSPCGV